MWSANWKKKKTMIVLVNNTVRSWTTKLFLRQIKNSPLTENNWLMGHNMCNISQSLRCKSRNCLNHYFTLTESTKNQSVDGPSLNFYIIYNLFVIKLYVHGLPRFITKNTWLYHGIHHFSLRIKSWKKIKILDYC